VCYDTLSQFSEQAKCFIHSNHQRGVYHQKKEKYSTFTHPKDPGTGLVATTFLWCGPTAGGLNSDTGGAYKLGK
jgi:hypothetical protein